MIVMALHSEWRVDPLWVVLLPHHARREALDKVMGGVHQRVEFIIGCCLCRSAILSFGLSFSRSVVWSFCRSAVLSFGYSVIRPFVHVTRHRNFSTSWVNSCSLFAVVFLTGPRVSQQSAVHSETVKLVHCVHEYGVASRGFQEFRISVTSQQDL